MNKFLEIAKTQPSNTWTRHNFKRQGHFCPAGWVRRALDLEGLTFNESRDRLLEASGLTVEQLWGLYAVNDTAINHKAALKAIEHYINTKNYGESRAIARGVYIAS